MLDGGLREDDGWGGSGQYGGAAAQGGADGHLAAARSQHVERLFQDLEAVKIINLPAEDRMRKVLAMAPNDFVAFRESLSGAELAQFAQGLSPQQKEIFAAMQSSTRMVGSEEMQVAAAPGHLQRAAVGGGDDRLLAEPLQCICAQEPE